MWTQAELDELRSAYRQGVKSVQFRDRKVEYRDLSEMKQIIDEAERALSSNARTHITPVTSRGYQ